MEHDDKNNDDDRAALWFVSIACVLITVSWVAFLIDVLPDILSKAL